jgi:PAS domain S-box-containing protein
MKRPVDRRSDLYSLGITLYEMLTGTLPFAAIDPMAWIHCHLARQPPPPTERASVPVPIAAIVMRLLAKSTEDRYQSAAGVAADLRRCLKEWQLHGSICPFTLGEHDASDRLEISERLYGREAEVGSLVAAFERVAANGMPEFTLVSGYSGIGKSSVVHQLRKVLAPGHGLFASGKFDQYKRDIPYSTLAQAFQGLIRPLLSLNEGQLATWRKALIDALGQNSSLIVSLVPDLECVIGAKPPPVPELSPLEAKRRFQRVFRRFLGIFACKEHPLTLFIDDLQWMDSATLELLQHLMIDSGVQYLLLVAAYRANEVGPDHPMTRMLEAIRAAGAKVHEIALSPLSLAHTGKLVADTLHCELERAETLAHLLQEKTGGNPFFAIQFFASLAEEKLLTFDPMARAWSWNVDRIRAMGCSENVADLMAEKLHRLSATTKVALTQLACLGNSVGVAALSLAHGYADETTVNMALQEAVLAGLIRLEDRICTFTHDRVQQAAYSSLGENVRRQIHTRIGRALLNGTTGGLLTEHLFDIANQFNRGTTTLTDPDEKTQVARINLFAGRKAKASTAFASACVYFSAGMARMYESDWGTQYELMFNLWLERAECEFLTGNLGKAEQLIAELLARSISNIDRASAYRLKVELHLVKSESPQAVVSGLTCLSLFGIDLPSHPTWDQVRAEYETILRSLDGRPIENLIELPLMTDPQLSAAMAMLSTLNTPAYFTDSNLYCLLLCRMVNLSLSHGVCGPSAHGYGYFGFILGPVFRRYGEGYRFAKLACDLVEKHGFIADRARSFHSLGLTAAWTHPISTAIDLLLVTYRAATEAGDLPSACFSMSVTITNLLLRNDPLDIVRIQSERNLDFVRKAHFNNVADVIVSQQRFIAAMQGRTTSLSSFSDIQFDENAFEARLTEGRAGTPLCMYWLLKLKALFLSGNYAAAFEAAQNAKVYIWAMAAHIPLLDYYYYTALTVAAIFENACSDDQKEWYELLKTHQNKLQEWASNYPPTFSDKHALVSAELARLEGRDLDAMRLYEQSIRSAREHGFVQNEAVAHEVAERFYAKRGFETIAHAYLRNAQYCYLRWGALGKVKQLDQLYPGLRAQTVSFPSTATIGTRFEHLDLATVVKASQVVSGEIEHDKLIKTLLKITTEHAAAERGLLILLRGGQPKIVAEATIGLRGTIEVNLKHSTAAPSELPESVLQYVVRKRESVILDDAATPHMFSEDAYVQRRRPRSVLCLPLVKQAELVGALYLENNLTPCVFTSDRTAVLELLASQAAISLENARLYSDLQHSEAFLAEGQRISSTGSFGWNPHTEEVQWSDQTYDIFEYDRSEKATVEHVLKRTHPDDVPIVLEAMDRMTKARNDFDFEHRLLMPDGEVKHVHLTARAMHSTSGKFEFVGVVRDVTEQKWAQDERTRLEQRLRQAEKMEAIGRFAGGIAHDFNNILAGVMAYGEIIFDDAPEGSLLKRYSKNVLTAAARGRDLVEQILGYSRCQCGKCAPVNVAHIVAETLELVRGGLPPGIRLESETPDVPLVVIGDPTKLHQIVMNLCRNAIHAISGHGTLRVAVEDASFAVARALSHGALQPGHYVRLIVEDSGTGMDAEIMARIFEPFFTTKHPGQGTGLGLSLVYAIVTDSGGAIDVQSTPRHGTTFTIYLRNSGGARDQDKVALLSLPQVHRESLSTVSADTSVLSATPKVRFRLGDETVELSTG